MRIVDNRRHPPLSQFHLETILHQPHIPKTLQTGVDNRPTNQSKLQVPAGRLDDADCLRVQQQDRSIQYTTDGHRKQGLLVAADQLLRGREKRDVYIHAHE